MQVGTFGLENRISRGFNTKIIFFTEKRELKEDVNLS
jgi:hypothetical protein